MLIQHASKIEIKFESINFISIELNEINLNLIKFHELHLHERRCFMKYFGLLLIL